MSFDSNTWYSIQNYGTDYFIGCQNVGVCGTTRSGLTDAEWFQLATLNGNQSFYVRSKAEKASSTGEPYCVNINTGQPTVVACDTKSADWGIGSWGGVDGKFFFSTQTGDTQRLLLSSNQSYSLVDYDGLSASNQTLMQWGITSRAPINDQSYSTIPAAIIGSNTASTMTPFPNTTTTSSVGSSTSSSTSTEASSRPAEVPSTFTMVVTPTVTASPASATGGSRTSSSTITPTVASSAGKLKIETKTVLTILLALSQLLFYLD